MPNLWYGGKNALLGSQNDTIRHLLSSWLEVGGGKSWVSSFLDGYLCVHSTKGALQCNM